jgi:hypothetical protein
MRRGVCEGRASRGRAANHEWRREVRLPFDRSTGNDVKKHAARGRADVERGHTYCRQRWVRERRQCDVIEPDD